MTREEAIKLLNKWYGLFPSEAYEALDMAIEALTEETPTINEKHQLSEETPTDTPTDLIYRQDAIDAIKMVLDDGGEWFVEAVNDIPSAGQNCVLCEYYTEIETDDGIKGKCTRRTGSDLIRRQDAINALTNFIWVDYPTRELAQESAEMVMGQVQSRLTEYKTFCGVPIEEATRIVQEHNAEPKTGWIPVSERLPERGKDVLVTRKYYGKDDGNKDSIYVEISACYADGEEWHGYSDEYKMNPKNHKVIAWMPLPEPWKDGEA